VPPTSVPPVPGLPADREGPVFEAPWQAQAFALVLSLYDKGFFTWPEWAAALATEIGRAAAAGEPDTGDSYYRHWLSALERLVTAKGLTTPDVLTRYRNAWDAAAERTPHGVPIELRSQDFSS
jgi:nitrile hydratase accessory protein